MWEMLMAAAFIMLLLLLLLLPETNPATVLYRRARRLEKLDETRMRQYKSAAEVAARRHIVSHCSTRIVAHCLEIYLSRPGHPVSELLHIACLRLLLFFLEAFPIVYQEVYGFNLGEMGVVFLANGVGSIMSFVIYNFYIYRVFYLRSHEGGFEKPDEEDEK